jgi:hypothetical protein
MLHTCAEIFHGFCARVGDLLWLVGISCKLIYFRGLVFSKCYDVFFLHFQPTAGRNAVALLQLYKTNYVWMVVMLQ